MVRCSIYIYGYRPPSLLPSHKPRSTRSCSFLLFTPQSNAKPWHHDPISHGHPRHIPTAFHLLRCHPLHLPSDPHSKDQKKDDHDSAATPLLSKREQSKPPPPAKERCPVAHEHPIAAARSRHSPLPTTLTMPTTMSQRGRLGGVHTRPCSAGSA